jgi:GDP-L-fucose synthase
MPSGTSWSRRVGTQHMTTSSNFSLGGPHIYVAGHRGMVGSAIVRRLIRGGYTNLVMRQRSELDLMSQAQTTDFFASQKIDVVILAAAKAGGIQSNATYPAEFLYENLMIQANVIHSAFKSGVRRLIFLGSSCIYPRDSSQPIEEAALLTGPLEPTNEPYAIAKIAGVKMCESYNRQYGTSYVSVMPTNLYGPNDNYDLENGHVLPALLRKAHESKLRGDAALTVWGSGRPMREFMYVDDLADACVFLMENDIAEGMFNVGTGQDVTIKELAELVMEVVGFRGAIEFDVSKPDGTPRKLLNVDKLKNMGWRASVPLREGIAMAYEDFCANHQARP